MATGDADRGWAASPDEGAGRLDLARLLPAPFAPRARERAPSLVEVVVDRVTDEGTADALEALAEALPRPPRRPRRRRVQLEAKLLTLGTIAALTFTFLAIRWELRRP